MNEEKNAIAAINAGFCTRHLYLEYADENLKINLEEIEHE
jgi:formiminotetrahydrofolate cyclodeaminase